MELYKITEKIEEGAIRAREEAEKARERFKGPRMIELGNGKELRIKIRGEEAEIKLFDSDEEILDLKEFAPENTKIKFSLKNKWSARVSPEGKTIYIGKFDDIKLLLSYLHEAGHLVDQSTSELALDARREHTRESLRDKGNSYPQKRLKAMAKEREMVTASERNAWAYALRQARKMEREYDIKILNRIGRVEDVKKYIDGFLRTYEAGYLAELDNLEIYTKEEMLRFFEQFKGEKETGQRNISPEKMDKGKLETAA